MHDSGMGHSGMGHSGMGRRCGQAPLRTPAARLIVGMG